MARQNAERRRTKTRKKRQADARKVERAAKPPKRPLTLGDGLAAGTALAMMAASGLTEEI